MDTRYAFKRKEDHKKRVYQNTSNLNENNYRKRYGRKRKHSRATEAMDGNYGSRLMVHGSRLMVSQIAQITQITQNSF